ncbi:hypothetical protein BC830DRAFT_1214851 [Chytriomyces sp. MP71]|nr:hypothetical protein BC830DRAFT_1214851 [Chytriomyces sp. MP71]
MVQSKRICTELLPALYHIQTDDQRYRVSNLRAPGAWDGDTSQCSVFTVAASVCSRTVFEVDVLFDAVSLTSAPDLLVLSPTPSLKLLRLRDVDDLVHWDAVDPKALRRALDSILHFFLKRECERIQRAGLEALAFDIGMLSHYPNLEYCLSDEGHGDAKVFLQFDLDFGDKDVSKLVGPDRTNDAMAVDGEANQHNDQKRTLSGILEYFGGPGNNALKRAKARISLIYSIEHEAIVNVEKKLVLSEHALSCLGSGPLDIPPLGATQSVMEWALEVHEIVKRRLDSMKELDNKKKRLCLALVQAFPGQLLEYDSTDFSTASFYFENKQATTKKDAICAVAIFQFFDTKVPTLTFLSPTRSKSGQQDDSVPDSKEVPVKFEFLSPVESNVQEIRSILRAQLPPFASGVVSSPSQGSLKSGTGFFGF